VQAREVARQPQEPARLVDGELVDEVVHLVTGVSLHPVEGDVLALSDSVDEWHPQITVGDRLLLRGGPAALQPPGPPLVA
jgi:hypothetical protein